MRHSFILSGLIWGVIVLGGTWLFDAGKTAQPKAGSSLLCGKTPEVGTTSILDRSMTGRRDGQYGIFSIRNDQPTILVAVLLDPGMTRKFQVVTVGAGSAVHVQVPSGRYGLGLMSGQSWCSLERGFVDGTMHSINGGVEIKPQLMTQAVVAPGETPGGIAVHFRELYRTEEIREGGLETRASDRGTIITQGSVNGVSIPFVIDTGASILTISPDIARQAGIHCTSKGQFITAMGLADGCRGVAREVGFGPFLLHDVEVAILAGGDNVLLGMNVLRRFTMVWQDDAVRITTVDAELQIPGEGSAGRGFAPVVPWTDR